MVVLRNFANEDAAVLKQYSYRDIPARQIEKMIEEWNIKRVDNKYFEMFAVCSDDVIVGTVSLYQNSKEVISIGVEIFPDFRERGFAKKAVSLACDIAKIKGYKIVFQQVRIDNTASHALNKSLGFETSGYEYINKRGNKVLIYLKSL